MSHSKVTADHKTIKKWAAKRGGRPANVEGTETGGQRAGLLRLDFGEKDDGLSEISWEEFFDKFEEAKLAFLHQDKTADGSESRFHKFVSRDSTGAE